jgi:hypothetical protein
LVVPRRGDHIQTTGVSAAMRRSFNPPMIRL